MENGQAESAPEASGLSDLASFLSDTPEKEPEEDQEAASADEATSDEADTDEDANNEQEDDPEADKADEEEPAPVETKISFKVKADDGTEETVELSPDELPAALMRQKDYTKKTQALAERETQAVQFLKTKHDEIRSQYTEQAEFYKQAVTQMAGIRTESEMAQLAQTDPAAWVAENQRQQSVRTFLATLDQSIQGERQRAKSEAEQLHAQSIRQMSERAWGELSKEKIDKPALTRIYGDVTKTYGFSPDELGNVYDPRLVKMMRDATAYQALKTKAPEVTRKAQAAPRMPSRQSNPAQERRDKALDDRFRGGRAKLNDLAQLLR